MILGGWVFLMSGLTLQSAPSEGRGTPPALQPHGGVRPCHQKSICLTQSTLGPDVVHTWSRYSPNLEETNPSYTTVWSAMINGKIPFDTLRVVYNTKRRSPLEPFYPCTQTRGQRGSSLITSTPPLGPHSRTKLGSYGGPWGGGAISYERGTPVH